MIVLRTLKLLSSSTNLKFKTFLARPMSEHIVPYRPSRWQWTKTKNFLMYYIYLGLIPITIIVTYANILIGPATLTEIPEDYVPKYWEYYRHPITRWIAKNISNNPQQDYEKYLHHLFEIEESRRIRMLEEQVKKKLSKRNDFQAYYYRPVTAKYQRGAKNTADKVKEIQGD